MQATSIQPIKDHLDYLSKNKLMPYSIGRNEKGEDYICGFGKEPILSPVFSVFKAAATGELQTLKKIHSENRELLEYGTSGLAGIASIWGGRDYCFTPLAVALFAGQTEAAEFLAENTKNGWTYVGTPHANPDVMWRPGRLTSPLVDAEMYLPAALDINKFGTKLIFGHTDPTTATMICAAIVSNQPTVVKKLADAGAPIGPIEKVWAAYHQLQAHDKSELYAAVKYATAGKGGDSVNNCAMVTLSVMLVALSVLLISLIVKLTNQEQQPQ